MGKRILISIISAAMLYWTTSYPFSLLAFFPLTYFVFGGWHILWRYKRTVLRDLQLLKLLMSIKKSQIICKKDELTFHKRWNRLAVTHPKKVAVVFQDQIWTYRHIVLTANRVANYISANLCLDVGDSVALIAENCPEYIVILLALSKLGCPTALINYNLKAKQLIHSINIASCKAVIVTNSFSDQVNQIEGDLVSTNIYSLNRGASNTNYKDIIQLSQYSPSTEPTGRENKITIRSTLCYIYTSGTTGLPKACIIPHIKAFVSGFVFYQSANIVSDDILYVTLPLYHSSALLISVGMLMHGGCKMYLRSKFSASHFWDDCVANGCTVIFYIGEVCRYLLSQPNKPSDLTHKVTRAIGNGLRVSLWNEFKTRFRVNRIIEFYAATEGYASTLNLISEPGYVGYLPVSMKYVPYFNVFYYSNFLARLDKESGEPVRLPNGLCIQCEPNEPGEILGIIREGPKKMIGYLSEEATKKKVIRNVFTRGDAYLRTGDVLSYNEFGFYTFLDRKGDTFRWKGENVSTNEVETIITSIIGHNDVIVYSAPIPGTEGRAGMLAIVMDDIDLESLLVNFRQALPSYSVPLFIRLISAPELTSTFKYRKVNFREEGFDINTITDPIFFLDPRCNKYVPLNGDLYDVIMREKLRL
ncbi:Long-chain fatty acid transport protein 4-like [Oopsacas minuta]|uniref:Long-chain-fatty-acid--CoA ligase n=1 Tax=Oopsacas minuta TaxID=111878 RepID=A0AAV7JMA2_9METZ|nr:Long-chain fatty acid transport protein 4-like [Oopsacas minuta]